MQQFTNHKQYIVSPLKWFRSEEIISNKLDCDIEGIDRIDYPNLVRILEGLMSLKLDPSMQVNLKIHNVLRAFTLAKEDKNLSLDIITANNPLPLNLRSEIIVDKAHPVLKFVPKGSGNYKFEEIIIKSSSTDLDWSIIVEGGIELIFNDDRLKKMNFRVLKLNFLNEKFITPHISEIIINNFKSNIISTSFIEPKDFDLFNIIQLNGRQIINLITKYNIDIIGHWILKATSLNNFNYRMLSTAKEILQNIAKSNGSSLLENGINFIFKQHNQSTDYEVKCFKPVKNDSGYSINDEEISIVRNYIINKYYDRTSFEINKSELFANLNLFIDFFRGQSLDISDYQRKISHLKSIHDLSNSYDNEINKLYYELYINLLGNIKITPKNKYIKILISAAELEMKKIPPSHL